MCAGNMWQQAKCSKDSNTDVVNQPYSSRSKTGTMESNKLKADVLIKDD